MTKIDIAALVADREAGTKGPWVVHEEPEEQIDICAADRPVGRFVPIMSRGMGYNDNVDDESRANARRIARVPDMEAALIAQDAELKRLRSIDAAISVTEDQLRRWVSALSDWDEGAEEAIAEIEDLLSARATLGDKP